MVLRCTATVSTLFPPPPSQIQAGEIVNNCNTKKDNITNLTYQEITIYTDHSKPKSLRDTKVRGQHEADLSPCSLYISVHNTAINLNI